MPKIGSAVGSIVHDASIDVSSILNDSRSAMEATVGEVTNSLANINLYSGGFTGMSKEGMESLKSALTTFCNNIQDTISNFKQDGDISSALKGQTQEAAIDFIEQIKSLLQAYVSLMRAEIAEADEAYENFMNVEKSISSDVQSTAQDIRSNASKIQLD